VFVQQLPGTQVGVPPQQMSPELAEHALPAGVHELETQACVVVLQIVNPP